ncbi:MAG: hypothetical protein MUP71_07800 [Candidatus Aminicenantes bacterium]|nr:hypothetical protein [Candidatus Aminicenantes bacterium]
MNAKKYIGPPCFLWQFGCAKIDFLRRIACQPGNSFAKGLAMMTVQAVRQALNGEKPRHLIPEWKERLRKQGTGYRG